MSQTLEELAKKTDALTYLNALKVTLTQIKNEVAVQEELREYMNRSGDRAKKLMKRADGQYRMFARLVNRESPFATDVTVDDSIPEDFEELRTLMENGNDA